MQYSLEVLLPKRTGLMLHHYVLRYPLGRLLTVLQPFPGSLVTDKPLRIFAYLSVGQSCCLEPGSVLGGWTVSLMS